ncbi:MAG: TonB-dependent receptor [Leptospiraceae bacterium]|nr:TonB-dependent receptor [Leptospiraceae bacterium]MDW7976351.1 TonB-dependent receptor [Leptospiraceae bacterium]
MKRLIFLFLLVLAPVSLLSQTATITGRVIDAQTGQPMLGVAVVIREIGAFTQTDFDGRYSLSVPPGTYNVIFQIIGYDTKTQRVTVSAGQNFSLNITMGVQVQVLQAVIVEERALNDTEASLLALQKKAPVVSDGISQEAIKRSPDSTASDVVKRVTGVTVVGGKYVFVRGLGERYSNTMLNGSILPSPEPEKKVVPLDLFPAPLVKNIRIIKSFVPEDPAEFSGGLVKIETVEYPDEFIFNVGVGIERNSITTGKEFQKIKRTEPYDYLGLGPSSILGLNKGWGLPGIAGALPLPVSLNPGRFFVTDSIADLAYLSFDQRWAPANIKAPENYSFNLSIGDSVFNRKFGYLYSTYYKKEYEQYNAIEYRWYGSYLLAGTWFPELAYIEPDYNQLRLANYNSEKVIWGNNINLAYRITNQQQIYLKTFFSTNSDKNFRDSFSRIVVPDNQLFITETSYYVAREIFSVTLGGRHGIQYIQEMRPHILTWHYNIAGASRDEPDRKNRVWTRSFGTDEPLKVGQNDGFVFYSFAVDDVTNWNVSYELEYPQWDGLNSKLKFGIDTYERTKNFKSKDYKLERLKDLNEFDFYPVPGDFTFNIFRLLENEYQFYERSALQPDAFESILEVNSRYIQTDLPVVANLRVIAGVRQEETYQKTWTRELTSTNLVDYIDQQCTPEGFPTDFRFILVDNKICPIDDYGVGDYRATDTLPSLNVVYEVVKDQNIRLAYYESITRPDARELSEFLFTPYFAGEIYAGNSTLRRTRLKNYDARWEWYITPEEYVGVSYFIKNITDPIELVGTPRTGGGNKIYTFINSEKGEIKGWEFDFRKDFLKFFRLELNFYFIDSNVEVISPITRELIARGFFPLYDKRVTLAPTNLRRPLQGQSDNVYNLKFYYFFDEEKKLGYVGLLYNYFSDRVLFVGTAGEPDVYEKGKGFWDFVAAYSPIENLNVKFSIKNIYNQGFETYQKSNLGGYKVPYESYKRGTDYSLSASYKF